MKNHFYIFNHIKGKNGFEEKQHSFFIFSLYEAVCILLENHVHRLPVIDPISNNVVFILTHKRILRYFYFYVSRGLFEMKF